MKKQLRGFTLVELLVAVGIIGVLASVSVVSIGSVRQKGRDAKRISEIREIQKALEGYFSTRNSYPATGEGITYSLGGVGGNYIVFCDTDAGFQADTANCRTTFMARVPADPMNTGATIYRYASVDGSSYNVTFSLETRTGDFNAGAHTATPGGIQ